MKASKVIEKPKTDNYIANQGIAEKRREIWESIMSHSFRNQGNTAGSIKHADQILAAWDERFNK